MWKKTHVRGLSRAKASERHANTEAVRLAGRRRYAGWQARDEHFLHGDDDDQEHQEGDVDDDEVGHHLLASPPDQTDDGP
ncbi:hypothetical protein C8039_02390 [Halogeometricum sp. wsp3]|nr:hypothetical protein C8039_02390 [Halogeometricum sp. wsp3]